VSKRENGQSVKMLIDFIDSWKIQRYSSSQALICGLDTDKLKTNIAPDSDGCSVIDYSDFLVLLNSIKIQNDDRLIEYQTGRKDFIL